MVAFAFTYAMPSQRVEALVVSKAASLTAKKVVKDVIKETAKEIAFEYALQAISKTWSAENDYKFEDNYDHYCAYEITPDGKCRQVMNIKKELTPVDIEKLDDQLEIEIDKAITSGSGFTKWQKFMDWFLPIWILAAAATALTYAFDPDVRSLFDEIAYNALVALGFIKPADPINVEKIIVDKTTGEPVPEGGSATGTGATAVSYVKETINTTGVATFAFPTSSMKNLTIVTQYDHDLITPTFPKINYTDGSGFGYTTINAVRSTTDPIAITQPSNYFTMTTSNIYKNDVLIGQKPYADSIPKTFMPYEDYSNIDTIMTRVMYQKEADYYQEHLFFIGDGDVYRTEMKIDPTTNFGGNYTLKSTTSTVYGNEEATTNNYRTPTMTTATKQVVYTNTDYVPVKLYNPLFSEIAPLNLPKTKYEDEEGKVYLPPPSSIPITQGSTGQTVTLSPNPVAGEEPILTNEDGQEVPDTDLVVNDPNITESPEGVPQVTPPSSQTNPNPIPIPLAPTTPPTEPPVPPPPPEDGGGGKPNIPLSLLLGLFKLLFAIIFFLIRMFTFIVTIQMIPPVPIPNEYFQWFTTVTILGVQPYPLIINTATFFLGFSIYKSIRRVFV